jgi:hypothetical protein
MHPMLTTHEDLKEKIEAMEQKYDQNFKIVFEAIRQLLESDEKSKPKIGYTVKERQKAFGKGKAKSVSDDHDILGRLDAQDR